VTKLLCGIAAALLLAGGGVSLLTRPIFLQPPDEPLVFDANSHGGPQNFLGGPQSFAPIEIWRPEGEGPFPAVILLHGCGGASRHEREWAARLVDWGYIAVIPDSFRPRYAKPSCSHSIVSVALRAQDLLNLTAFLRTYLAIPAERTGVMGFSQGGTAAIDAAWDTRGAPPPFQAIVNYYTVCITRPEGHVAVDVLLLLGADDNPSLTASCDKLVLHQAGTPHPVQIRMYPKAVHIFDTLPDSSAALASFADAKAFLAAHLKAK
jgi:dienelactone hydrolase